ncbi:MAG: hypothetical protein U0325_04340 [Polyangiales bacterium]
MRPRFALAALLLLLGCADDTTGRARVRFDLRARGVDTTFTTSRGWAVRVAEARVSLGPVRWYEGPPIFALRWWERALGVSVAHAHPGHYVPGEALADMLTPRVVDLASGAVALSAADGVTGAAQSAHLALQPPPAGGDAATVFVRGEATQGAQRVRFRGALALTLNLEGVTAGGNIDRAGWELQVSVGRWVDRVDFAALTPSAPDAEVEFATDSQAANALYRAATSVGSYRVVKLSADDAGRAP